MQMLINAFALVFFIIYVLVAFIWPSVRTYKQSGINPIVFENKDDAHSYIGKCFKILMLLVLIVILIFAFIPTTYIYLVPIVFLDDEIVKLVGIALCVSSLVWTAIAQFQMGISWRIGIDLKNKTQLKTSGLFAISRNPIFLGMVVTLLGYFLLLPTAITLVVLVAGHLLIQIQIRLEEDFLTRQHGEEYERYKLKARRML
jgi:protein-S-isoprenylcysteine O-methyltransferase Ste14